jgi:hypothetical protein
MPQGPAPAGLAPGALPPTPAAAGGGQLSGVAAGTQDPVTAMRQTLRTMAQQIAAANPKMKGSQIFAAMQQELGLMKGVEPEVKDAMSQYVETQKLNAKYAGLAQAFQVGMAKIQSAKSIAEMQAATKALHDKVMTEFGIELQGMKDETAEKDTKTRAAAETTAAGERAVATTDAAKIRNQGALAVQDEKNKGAIPLQDEKNKGALEKQSLINQGGAQRARITAGTRVPVSPNVAKLPDGTRLEKDGTTWIKRGDKLIAE